MMQGQYILDRWMVGMIQAICQEQGIAFTSYSDDWLLELRKEDQIHRIFGYKFDANDSVSSTITGDKVAAYQILSKADIASVEHRLVRTKAGSRHDWADGFDAVVVKPLDGTSGHGVALLDSVADVEGYISAHPSIAAWAVSPYEKIEQERRFIILDGKVLCQYEKKPVVVNGLPMFNLGLGAQADTTPTTTEEEKLAQMAIKTLGLRLAAVDIIRTVDGHKVLEVNDGIMMENFMRQDAANKSVAHEVYSQIIATLFQHLNS